MARTKFRAKAASSPFDRVATQPTSKGINTQPPGFQRHSGTDGTGNTRSSQSSSKPATSKILAVSHTSNNWKDSRVRHDTNPSLNPYLRAQAERDSRIAAKQHRDGRLGGTAALFSGGADVGDFDFGRLGGTSGVAGVVPEAQKGEIIAARRAAKNEAVLSHVSARAAKRRSRFEVDAARAAMDSELQAILASGALAARPTGDRGKPANDSVPAPLKELNTKYSALYADLRPAGRCVPTRPVAGGGDTSVEADLAEADIAASRYARRVAAAAAESADDLLGLNDLDEIDLEMPDSAGATGSELAAAVDFDVFGSLPPSESSSEAELSSVEDRPAGRRLRSKTSAAKVPARKAHAHAPSRSARTAAKDLQFLNDLVTAYHAGPLREPLLRFWTATDPSAPAISAALEAADEVVERLSAAVAPTSGRKAKEAALPDQKGAQPPSNMSAVLLGALLTAIGGCTFARRMLRLPQDFVAPPSGAESLATAFNISIARSFSYAKHLTSPKEESKSSILATRTPRSRATNKKPDPPSVAASTLSELVQRTAPATAESSASSIALPLRLPFRAFMLYLALFSAYPLESVQHHVISPAIAIVTVMSSPGYILQLPILEASFVAMLAVLICWRQSSCFPEAVLTLLVCRRRLLEHLLKYGDVSPAKVQTFRVDATALASAVTVVTVGAAESTKVATFVLPTQLPKPCVEERTGQLPIGASYLPVPSLSPEGGAFTLSSFFAGDRSARIDEIVKGECDENDRPDLRQLLNLFVLLDVETHRLLHRLTASAGWIPVIGKAMDICQETDMLCVGLSESIDIPDGFETRDGRAAITSSVHVLTEAVMRSLASFTQKCEASRRALSLEHVRPTPLPLYDPIVLSKYGFFPNLQLTRRDHAAAEEGAVPTLDRARAANQAAVVSARKQVKAETRRVKRHLAEGSRAHASASTSLADSMRTSRNASVKRITGLLQEIQQGTNADTKAAERMRKIQRNHSTKRKMTRK